MKNMTITQLEYIVAVHAYKSFSIAANYCFVTQPTLSMQIQKLEEELNIQIFEFCGRPYTPDARPPTLPSSYAAIQAARVAL